MGTFQRDYGGRTTDKFSFGDKVENVCASETNPIRFGYFVERKKGLARLTDKKGKFWDVYLDHGHPLKKIECA